MDGEVAGRITQFADIKSGDPCADGIRWARDGRRLPRARGAGCDFHRSDGHAIPTPEGRIDGHSLSGRGPTYANCLIDRCKRTLGERRGSLIRGKSDDFGDFARAHTNAGSVQSVRK